MMWSYVKFSVIIFVTSLPFVVLGWLIAPFVPLLPVMTVITLNLAAILVGVAVMIIFMDDEDLGTVRRAVRVTSKGMFLLVCVFALACILRLRRDHGGDISDLFIPLLTIIAGKIFFKIKFTEIM